MTPDQEELAGLLRERSLYLHKLSGIRRVYSEKEKQRLAKEYREKADKAWVKIVEWVCAAFPDRRPLPPTEIEYGGETYTLARWDGVTAVYSKSLTFGNFTIGVGYYAHVIPYRTHIAEQLSRH